MTSSFLALGAVLVASFYACAGELTQESPNTCSREELVQEEFQVPYHKPYQIVTTTFCLVNWPPVCEQKKTVYRLSYRTETRTKLQTNVYCCPGYAQHGDMVPR